MPTLKEYDAQNRKIATALQKHLPIAAGLMYGSAAMCKTNDPDIEFRNHEIFRRDEYLRVGSECEEAYKLEWKECYSERDYRQNCLKLENMAIALVQVTNLCNNIFLRLPDYFQENIGPISAIYIRFRDQFDEALKQACISRRAADFGVIIHERQKNWREKNQAKVPAQTNAS